MFCCLRSQFHWMNPVTCHFHPFFFAFSFFLYLFLSIFCIDLFFFCCGIGNANSSLAFECIVQQRMEVLPVIVFSLLNWKKYIKRTIFIRRKSFLMIEQQTWPASSYGTFDHLQLLLCYLLQSFGASDSLRGCFINVTLQLCWWYLSNLWGELM